MGKVHVISAKPLGKEMWYYIPFPTDKFSKEEAMAQFRQIELKATTKDYPYPYTAYEYDGDIFRFIVYSGIEDESKF